MSSWLPFKIPDNMDITKRMETVREKATAGVAVVKEGAAVVKEAAGAGMQRATVGAVAGAAAVKEAAGATAEKLKAQAIANSALVQSHARLQQTCRDCLELTGATPEPGITSDALARQLQLRWLQLIKAAEAMAAKGKGYKAQAKYEAERAEKAIAAGRELQAQLHAARQRIAELEAAAAQARGGTGDAGGASEGVGGSAGDDDGLSAFVASPCSASVPGDALLGGELSPLLAVTPSQPLDDGGNGHVQQGEGGAGGGGRTGSLVASTPAFLHEAEFDLKMQLSSPEMLAAAAEDMPAAARAGTSGSAGTTPREANLLGPSLSVRIVPVAGDRVQLSLE